MNGSFLVLDASAAVKAVLPNPLQTYCLALVQTFAEIQPSAPALWAHETTSAIAKAFRFGEITESEARQSLEKLDALGVRLFVADADQNRSVLDWTLRLQRASANAVITLSSLRFWNATSGLPTSACSMHSRTLTWAGCTGSRK